MTRLSSKGQLVIPKKIRESLNLRAGTEFHVTVEAGKIVLEPVTESPIDALYGRYADLDMLSDLEAEHQRELHSERQTLRS